MATSARALMLCTALGSGAVVTNAAADQGPLKVVISKGNVAPDPIAIVPFAWRGEAAQVPVESVGAIVASDLARSGLFEPLKDSELPGRPGQPSEINFADFRLLQVPSLVVGTVEPTDPGSYGTRFWLFDVLRSDPETGGGTEILHRSNESVPPRLLRRTAHQISDAIYEQLTGQRGAFDTQIAYITETRAAEARTYKLNISDSDGFNAVAVLTSSEPIVSPAWSPDGRKLAYVSFEDGKSRIFLQDVYTQAREAIAEFPGLNSAPAWSPDGSRLAMTLSKDGNPEIYVMRLRSRRLRRLTSNSAIDTEPAWSPDGKQLVFTSDRGGRPQLYQMPAQGGRAVRLTFEGGYNAGASYSPDGTHLVFVHRQDSAFRIATLDLESRALRVLTSSSLDESPTFAPNGQMILYATQGAEGATLAAVSNDGNVRQTLASSGSGVREPAWSPFRPR